MAEAPSFIERQFPVSKISKESYKERMAVAGQTLTGLGKWWGRKPLVLVRATILGLLLPATDDPEKDREIFLTLMTMDDEGMLLRRKPIPKKVVYRLLPPGKRLDFFTADSEEDNARWKKGLLKETKDELQDLAFLSMSYDDRLGYADRPEQVRGPSLAAWKRINAHLGTHAQCLTDLVQELGSKRFGHIPRVGDAFCGGGSVPFEAARMGCEAFGSDLNPVAGLLTWASMNLIGGGKMTAEWIQEFQQEIYAKVDAQVTEWGIEHDGGGWRADAYLYCTETRCPECGWMIPLAPSWVIADKIRCAAELEPDPKNKRFAIQVRDGLSRAAFKAASDAGTVGDSDLICPNSDCRKRTPISAIRRDGLNGRKYGLRQWENGDVVPRPNDVFLERLYCIRWFRYVEDVDGKVTIEREYRTVTADDEEREDSVLDLLGQRFAKWQESGAIPSRLVEIGDETSRLVRERGWTHWHHLYHPRQLLVHGLWGEYAIGLTSEQAALTYLNIGRFANWNSRLSRWLSGQSGGLGGGKDTYYNQALNTIFNYCVRGHSGLSSSLIAYAPEDTHKGHVSVADARSLTVKNDWWITDPPYADAVNYHELSELFLAWYGSHLGRLFPSWPTDSRRALAVRGDGEDFRRSMVACYRRLNELTPDNGVQVVMFTHQDSAVWADLALILWAAGLHVTAAWCIATETGAGGIKEGNYVQGTVIMVLRKQLATEAVFLDEVYQAVEAEVRHQLDSMMEIDDKDDPNFGDTDYQLAAYAAALRVLTANPIEDVDIEYELSKQRQPGERSPVQELIDNAVAIACDHLVPRGVDRDLWRMLSKCERMYLKGIEMESHGEYRSGVYQELARGFGVKEYKFLLGSDKANQTRLKTASELGRRDLDSQPKGTLKVRRKAEPTLFDVDSARIEIEREQTRGGSDGDRGEFSRSLLRHVLFAVHKTRETDDPANGLTWLKTELGDYWSRRERIIEILDFLQGFFRNASMRHWHDDAEAARILAGSVRNDHV